MFQQTILKVIVVLASTGLGALPCVAQSTKEPYSPCGPIYGIGYGPFDYRTATTDVKERVETYHFTPNVESLKKGESSYVIGGDIDYTLRAFPNHPRALLSMSNLALRQRVAMPQGARWPVDCYFERAVRFQPDDGLVRLVFGVHLTRTGRKDAAREQLLIAEQHPIDMANFYYNLGLAFLDVDDADRALALAWRAYGQGYELMGLRRRLEKIGKWRDPEK